MKENKTKSKAGGLRAGLIVSIVVGLLMWSFIVPYAPTIDQIKDTNQEVEKSWHTVWEGDLAALASEYALAADTSGITEIFFHNNTAFPNNTYSTNNTYALEADCNASHLGFASADDFYTELAHSTYFDIAVRIRANKTICANATDEYGVFNGARLRVNITSASLSLGTLTPLIRVETYNNTAGAYMYCNYWINWTGGTYTPVATGFQIAADSSNTITEIRFEAYY
jgi:hypothetical protein